MSNLRTGGFWRTTRRCARRACGISTMAWAHFIARRLFAESVYDLAEVYRDLLDRNELAGFEVAERFYEVGSFAGMAELSDMLKA